MGFFEKELLEVEMGSHQIVEIEKLFGPLIACDVRVFIDGTDWVVQREVEGENAGWEEMARFDCQDSLVFEEAYP